MFDFVSLVLHDLCVVNLKDGFGVVDGLETLPGFLVHVHGDEDVGQSTRQGKYDLHNIFFDLLSEVVFRF